MKVPLPGCFATLGKGVDGNNADEGYHGICIVLGWKDGCSNSIENFEHHIPVFIKYGNQITP
jgi:hypothetical protein